jgi:hypothetical protein
MPDLRKISYPRHFWDADERAYVAHLEAHETLKTAPGLQPEPGDNEYIRSLFDIIRTSELAAKNARLLILALRRAGKDKDHATDVPEIVDDPARTEDQPRT